MFDAKYSYIPFRAVGGGCAGCAGRGEYNVKKSYPFRDTKITVPEQKFLFNFLHTLDKIAVSYLNNSKMFSFIQFASF